MRSSKVYVSDSLRRVFRKTTVVFFCFINLQVVRHGNSHAFGVFLYALRHEGYENIFNFLREEILPEVFQEVESIVYPPPPPPYRPLWEQVEAVYVSYSRLQGSLKTNVHHLCEMLAAYSIDVVLDDYYSVDMADNEPAWIAEQFNTVSFVIVILDDKYPLNLSRAAAEDEQSQADDETRMRRTLVECQLIQGDLYRQRNNVIIPVLFDSVEIPLLLASMTAYRLPHRFLSNNEQFQRLVCRILGEDKHKNLCKYYECISQGQDHHPVQEIGV